MLRASLRPLCSGRAAVRAARGTRPSPWRAEGAYGSIALPRCQAWQLTCGRRWASSGAGGGGSVPQAPAAIAAKAAEAAGQAAADERKKERDRNMRIIKTLATHLWPDKALHPDANSLKAR